MQKRTSKLFHRVNDVVHVIDNNNGQVTPALLPEIYTVDFNKMTGEFFLNAGADIGKAQATYGKVQANVERFLNTWESRDRSTGVILHGHKGTGKTLLMRETCLEAIKKGYPVILVNNSYSGEAFNKFIQTISQKAVVVFEEFDKVYTDQEDIDQLLSLLDGIYPTNKLWIFTTNSEVPYYFSNRTERVFYSINFLSTLDIEIVEQYCEDSLLAANRTKDVVLVATTASTFNFDMLKGLVEELNRYPELSLAEVLEFLNICPSEEGVPYDIKVTHNATNTVLDGLYRMPYWDTDLDLNKELVILERSNLTNYVIKEISRKCPNLVSGTEEYSAELKKVMKELSLITSDGDQAFPTDSIKISADGTIKMVNQEFTLLLKRQPAVHKSMYKGF